MYSRPFLVLSVFALLSWHLVEGFNLRDNEDKEKSNSTGATNATDVDNLDDRLNLNFNLAQAQGVGRYGGLSHSNSLSYGVNAGIRGPGGQYQNLFSKTGSQSNGYSSGPGAPLTFANTGSRVRPGHAGGNANAGVFGGRGSSYATSQNQNIAIPLDNQGTVLFSNLQERNATKPVKTDNSKPDKDEPAVLVFS